MKHCIRFFLAVVLMLSLFALASCGTTPDEPKPAEYDVTVYSYDGTSTVVKVSHGEMPPLPVYDGPVYWEDEKLVFTGWNREPEPVTIDMAFVPIFERTPRASYEITWLFEGDNALVTTVKEGAIPTPPEAIGASYETNIAHYDLKGFSPALTAAFANADYTAEYTETLFSFEIVFSVNGQETKQTLLARETPTYTGSTDKPADDRYSYVFAGWDHPIEQVCRDMKYTAVYTQISPDKHAFAFSDEMLAIAYGTGTVNYDVGNGQKTGPWNAMTSLFYLLLEERSTPGIVPVREAILRQLRGLIVPESEPDMAGGPNWSFATCTAALALAKSTPSIWSQLTEDEVARLDLIMRCFLYTSAWQMNDVNDYRTTTTMNGNFNKGWNPNYRFAALVPMFAARVYFGSVEAVDELLLNFDCEKTIAELDAFGFKNAKTSFTRASKELLENGGVAYNSAGVAMGSGKGIRAKFTYKNKTLDDFAAIFHEEMHFNYSGGKVVSRVPDSDPKAYIVTGKTSPMEGKLGMYLELNGGDAGGVRSSASYSMADWHMSTTLMVLMMETGMYSLSEMPAKLVNYMHVGNTDLLFKLHEGYQNYSNGKASDVFKFGGYSLPALIEDIWLNHIAVLAPMPEVDAYLLHYNVNGAITDRSSATDSVVLATDILPEGYVWFDGKTFYRGGHDYKLPADEVTLTAVPGAIDGETAVHLGSKTDVLKLAQGATVDAQNSYLTSALYEGWIVLDITLSKDGNYDLPNAFNIQYKHTGATNPATALLSGDKSGVYVTENGQTVRIADYDQNNALAVTVLYHTKTGKIVYYKKTATGYEKILERISANEQGTAGRIFYIYMSKNQADTEKHLTFSVSVYQHIYDSSLIAD